MNGKQLLLAAALHSAYSLAAFGQASAINGQILGTVTDPSGASVSGAKVTAKNVGTNVVSVTQTTGTG